MRALWYNNATEASALSAHFLAARLGGGHMRRHSTPYLSFVVDEAE